MQWLAALALLALAPLALIAQESDKPLTNADVLSMTKAGLGEQTIILAIGNGPTRFDTSPQGLIELKKAGVGDRVLDAMLSESKSRSAVPPVASAGPDPSKLLDRALNAIGPREKLTSIHVIRHLGASTLILAGGNTSFELERVTAYPDRLDITRRSSSGVTSKLVLTPGFNYIVNGKMTSSVPAPDLEALRTGLQFDYANVAQHPGDFVLTYDGVEDLGSEKCEKLRLKNRAGKEVVWSIDQTGRIRRITGRGSTGEVVTDLSDYRLIDGINVSFKRRSVESGRISEFILRQYEINPATDSAWFSPPAEQPMAGLRVKVLEANSVPYEQKIGGGISTTCNIAGSANTSLNATLVGNSAFGNANTTSSATMHCSSYDTTMRWPHMLNAMLVEASDGNAYIIACDRAWRWSKCVPLRAGEIFNARQTSKGMAVQAFNAKGQESEPTYAILQSKSLR